MLLNKCVLQYTCPFSVCLDVGSGKHLVRLDIKVSLTPSLLNFSTTLHYTSSQVVFCLLQEIILDSSTLESKTVFVTQLTQKKMPPPEPPAGRPNDPMPEGGIRGGPNGWCPICIRPVASMKSVTCAEGHVTCLKCFSEWCYERIPSRPSNSSTGKNCVVCEVSMFGAETDWPSSDAEPTTEDSWTEEIRLMHEIREESQPRSKRPGYFPPSKPFFEPEIKQKFDIPWDAQMEQTWQEIRWRKHLETSDERELREWKRQRLNEREAHRKREEYQEMREWKEQERLRNLQSQGPSHQPSSSGKASGSVGQTIAVSRPSTAQNAREDEDQVILAYLNQNAAERSRLLDRARGIQEPESELGQGDSQQVAASRSPSWSILTEPDNPPPPYRSLSPPPPRGSDDCVPS
jgi:hypothetical protein